MERLQRSVDPTDLVERFSAVVETITEAPMTKGNRVTLLTDGQATYAAMFRAICNAKDHINLESYIFENDEAGRTFADRLLQKQAEGVQVRIIYDSLGSIKTPAAFFQQLRDAGIQVVAFNPLNPLKDRYEGGGDPQGPPEDTGCRRQARHNRWRQHQQSLLEQSPHLEKKRQGAGALA